MCGLCIGFFYLDSIFTVSHHFSHHRRGLRLVASTYSPHMQTSPPITSFFCCSVPEHNNMHNMQESTVCQHCTLKQSAVNQAFRQAVVSHLNPWQNKVCSQYSEPHLTYKCLRTDGCVQSGKLAFNQAKQLNAMGLKSCNYKNKHHHKKPYLPFDLQSL